MVTKTLSKAEFIERELRRISPEWRNAPPEELYRAAALCVQYNLNPFARHISLLVFNKGKPNEQWATVFSIEAIRLLAKRKVEYTYESGPRRMTKPEEKDIFGEEDANRIWFITILKDSKGNIYPGYGCWPMDKNLYGGEQGNTPHNMAAIHSERQAFSRMGVLEVPYNIQIVDAEWNAPEAELNEAQAETDVKRLWPGESTGGPMAARSEQLETIYKLAEGKTPETMKTLLNHRYEIQSSKELTADQADNLIDYLRGDLHEPLF